MAWNRSETAVETKRRHLLPKGRTGALVTSLVIACVAVVAVVVWPRGESKSDVVSSDARAADAGTTNDVRMVIAAIMGRTNATERVPPAKRNVRKTMAARELYGHLTGEDRENAEAVQAALDAGDFATMVRAAERALRSANSEVREAAVEALGWFGTDAIPELTACLADPNEDVRQSAENAWELALQDIDDAHMRFEIASAAFGRLTGKDILTTLGGQMANAATDWIDSSEDDETASKRRVEVVQSLFDILEGGTSFSSEAAKEVYSDITGHEWRGADEAERYLADPDNYEEPEDADEE